jgi:hypothetical protein
MLFGGTGFFIDKFEAGAEEGIVWLHGHRNVFEKTLLPGEQFDVEPAITTVPAGALGETETYLGPERRWERNHEKI